MTYEVNRDIQNEQFQHAEALADAEAKGTARVVQGNFRSADDAYVASLEACQYKLYRLEATIPLADRKLLASRLSVDQWRAVALGLEQLKRQFDRSRATQAGALTADDVEGIHNTRDSMFKAQEALADLAQTPAVPIEKVNAGNTCPGV